MHSQESPQRWKIVATVSFYICSALSMVMINKWVLTTTTIPLTFLALQILITILLLQLSRSFNLFEFKMPVIITLEVVKGLKYLTLLNLAGLTFNTYTLILVDASFYQVARGLVLPLTVFASYMFLKTRPSRLILAACTVVSAGFVLGIVPIPGSSTSYSVRGFTPLGIFFGLASSASTAMHVVVIKKSLAVVNNSVMDLAWYSNGLTLLCLMPFIVVLEFGKAIEFFFGGGVAGPEMGKFLLGTFLTGLGGFLISIAGILSVKITSPITHMVSSAVRGVAQTGLGVWLFGDIITVNKGCSVGTILIGSIWYTWLKHVESSSQDGRSTGAYQRVPTEPKEATPDLEKGVVVEFDADLEEIEERRRASGSLEGSSRSSTSTIQA